MSTSMKAMFSRGRLASAACACALALGACEMGSPETEPCRPAMPKPSEFLGDPAFATLQYRNRVNYEASRGAGYDLWGDSKFDYKAGLQYSLVPNRKARAGAQFCAQDVALRLALPMDAPRREMLRAFVRSAAARTTLNAEELQARVAALAAKREKYRPIAKDAAVTVESGLVSSSIRGDFFVVAFIWNTQ